MPILNHATNINSLNVPSLSVSKELRRGIVGKRVVYVGGLTESVSDNGLRDLFNKYGTVARAYRLYCASQKYRHLSRLPLCGNGV